VIKNDKKKSIQIQKNLAIIFHEKGFKEWNISA